jgi:hypothetical protein
VHKIEELLIKIKNTAPGEDGVPAAALKMVWPYIRNTVITLFCECMYKRWHPRPFHSVIICMLPKVGKGRDWNSPHSYKPIVLLAILDKALEKIIARRLAWITIKKK